MSDHIGQEVLDWTLLAEPGIEDVCDRAARAVAIHPRYGVYVEYEDLKQEAAILAAGRPDIVRRCLDPETSDTLGLLYHWLSMALIDEVKTVTRRGERSQSYEVRYDEETEGYLPRAPMPHMRGSVLYDRELVESLLPGVWDEAFCYGVQQENAPDADMPRAATNKATGNTLAAHLADIKTGWREAPLTDKERRALLLMYGLDWSVKEVAFNQGCTHPVMSVRLTNAVGKIVAALNGSDAELYPEEAA